MTRKLIFVDTSKVGKLHCDACHYDLPHAMPWETVRSGILIGYPCPICRASMLTARDHSSVMKMFRWVEWVNKWFGWLGKEQPSPDALSVSIKVHDNETHIKVGRSDQEEQA